MNVKSTCSHVAPAGEDLFAYDNFFFKMRGGVFLELGALDGFTFSNTLLFERYLGWRVTSRANVSG